MQVSGGILRDREGMVVPPKAPPAARTPLNASGGDEISYLVTFGVNAE